MNRDVQGGRRVWASVVLLQWVRDQNKALRWCTHATIKAKWFSVSYSVSGVCKRNTPHAPQPLLCIFHLKHLTVAMTTRVFCPLKGEKGRNRVQVAENKNLDSACGDPQLSMHTMVLQQPNRRSYSYKERRGGFLGEWRGSCLGGGVGGFACVWATAGGHHLPSQKFHKEQGLRSKAPRNQAAYIDRGSHQEGFIEA